MHVCKIIAREALIKVGIKNISGYLYFDGEKLLWWCITVQRCFLKGLGDKMVSIHQIKRTHMQARCIFLSSFVTYEMPLVDSKLERMKILSNVERFYYVHMVLVLNQNLGGDTTLNITKVSNKLYK